MDMKPPFSVSVESENEHHIVTVNDDGAVVSRETFRSREKADKYAKDEHERLSRKYAAMGRPAH